MYSQKRCPKIPISYCICPECKREFPIPRPKRQREKEHKKNLFCPWCGEVLTMTEIRDFDVQKNALGEVVKEAFAKK